MAEDARLVLRNYLAKYGLGELEEWAMEAIKTGTPQATVELELREQPAFKKRFPALEAMGKKNRAISIDAYVAFEQEAAKMMKSYGLPEGFYDQPEDFAKFLEGDVSLQEVNQRLILAANQANKAPAQVKQKLQEMYGVNQSGILAYFVDPDKALPTLQDQWTAAQYSSQSEQSGVGPLTTQQSEQIAQATPYTEKTAGAFAEMAQQKELNTAMAGEEGKDFSSFDQIQAATGQDVEGASVLAKRARTRKATFEGKAASFSQGQGGAQVGLGDIK